MRKFLAYFHMTFSDALVYRATGFIWMLNDLGPALVMIIFWAAAFQTKETISGPVNPLIFQSYHLDFIYY